MKRRLLRLCVFLLLGAIVNVAVAWACALWVNERAPAAGGIPATSLLKDVFGNEVHFNYMAFGNANEGNGWLVSRRFAVGRTIGDQPHTCAVHEVSSGFPIISLTGQRVSVDGQAVGQYAILLPEQSIQTIGAFAGSCLPLRAIWPGFAIDTLFYAAIIWLFFALPFKLRRHFRARRKLCPHCAYPIGTSDVCTECGKAVSGETG
jgi:hypothetical protein